MKLRKLSRLLAAGLSAALLFAAGIAPASAAEIRVTVDGKTRFTCVEGPEFDAHLIDFDEAMRRQNMYRNNPKTDPETHKCSCHG